ncbi:MAG: ATP-binding protein [bacterium]
MLLWLMLGLGLVAIVSIVIYFVISKFSKKHKVDSRTLQEISQDNNVHENQEKILLDAIADGVYIVDFERNLTLLNPAAEKMTGWNAAEVTGIKCWSVMSLKDQKDNSVCQDNCPVLACWKSGEYITRDDTCFLHHKNKNTVQISSSYTPLKDNYGHNVGAVCIFRDETEKKEIQRQRDEFVSTASHELRTPITALEGYISIVGNDKICKTDDKAKEYLEKAHNTALGMSTLVKNLLTVTKIEDTKIQFNKTIFSLHDLVEETVESLQGLAAERKLYLRLNETESQAYSGERAIGRSLNVFADKDKTQEVLYNLIENALKYSDDGGVDISIAYDHDFATVCVADTGLGISGDVQEHIFEKFYRADNTSTRETGGTGLGLFITRSIVEMSGGKIWLESQVGKGSKFYFTLPIRIE